MSKKIAEALIVKMVKDENINYFNLYRSKDHNCKYYYSICGQLNGNTFNICIRKSELTNDPIFEISESGKEVVELHNYLFKKTGVKFTIS